MEKGGRTWSQAVNWTLFGRGVRVIRDEDIVFMTKMIVEMV
jgi:hypothetical protein